MPGEPSQKKEQSWTDFFRSIGSAITNSDVPPPQGEIPPQTSQQTSSPPPRAAPVQKPPAQDPDTQPKTTAANNFNSMSQVDINAVKNAGGSWLGGMFNGVAVSLAQSAGLTKAFLGDYIKEVKEKNITELHSQGSPLGADEGIIRDDSDEILDFGGKVEGKPAWRVSETLRAAVKAEDKSLTDVQVDMVCVAYLKKPPSLTQGITSLFFGASNDGNKGGGVWDMVKSYVFGPSNDPSPG